MYGDKAKEEQREQNKRLSDNLTNVVGNDYIIWDVFKASTPGQVFETNKSFSFISTRLLKLYEYDNKMYLQKNYKANK